MPLIHLPQSSPESPPGSPLPFVDEHAVHVAAQAPLVWEALDRHRLESLRFDPGHPLARILDPDPSTGFAVVESHPPRHLRLAGRHRFAEYELELELDPTGDGTILRARTFAAFPGWQGRLYRALVIGSGGHRIIVRHLLRSVARASGRDVGRRLEGT